MSQFIEMFKGDDQVPLGDICNIEKGATITRNDVLPGDIPVVAGGQEPSCYHNVANREAGAITVSASGAYAGYINLWSCPIFASDCNTVISKDAEKTDQTFVYFGLKAMQKQIYGLQKGGAQHMYMARICKNSCSHTLRMQSRSSFPRWLNRQTNQNLNCDRQ